MVQVKGGNTGSDFYPAGDNGSSGSIGGIVIVWDYTI